MNFIMTVNLDHNYWNISHTFQLLPLSSLTDWLSLRSHGYSINLIVENKIHHQEHLLSKVGSLQSHNHS